MSNFTFSSRLMRDSPPLEIRVLMQRWCAPSQTLLYPAFEFQKDGGGGARALTSSTSSYTNKERKLDAGGKEASVRRSIFHWRTA